MTRFYDPTTGTEALEGVHDVSNATAMEDMPEASREWFERPAADGKQWVTDPVWTVPGGTGYSSTDRPAAKGQRNAHGHAQSWLRTDHVAVLQDSKYYRGRSEQATTCLPSRTQESTKREAATRGYPSQTWRPVLSVRIDRFRQ